MNSKKALIYNKYLSTAGGGERACFDMALALVASEYQVIIASDDPHFSQPLEVVTSKFGISQNLEFRKFDTLDAVVDFAKNSDLDLFVNHTYASFLPNPVKGSKAKAIYLMMFPRLNNSEQIEALNSYDLVLSISEFSATYLNVYAENLAKLNVRHEVLELPISDSHLSLKSVDVEEKEKLIINIGRYNVRGHSKCQLDVIKTFKNLKANNLIDSEWKLVCAGQLNRTEENLAYFKLCLSEAEGEDITVLSDISFKEMQDFYRKATILIQMTGFDLPFGEAPERCEHLGLVALDCMAYGVIPVCYQRTGIAALIRHAVDGFFFSDLDEARSYVSLISDEFKADFHKQMLVNMVYTKEQNTFEHYSSKLNNLLSS